MTPACQSTYLCTGIASPDLVSMLVDDKKGDDALISSNALVAASPRCQGLVVESVKATEDDLA